MIGWIRTWLIGTFCRHKWEIMKEMPIKDKSGQLVGTCYEQKCWKCGELRVKNLI